MNNMKCEICGKIATYIVDRKWHDGIIDLEVLACDEHSCSDTDGMWKMVTKTKIEGSISYS